jgi:hypothetical protein
MPSMTSSTKIMQTHTSHIQRLRKKKKINYSNYQFALALYNIYKEESRKEARLPIHDFRNRVFQKQSGIVSLKQKLAHYLLTIRKAITNNVFIGKEKPQIVDGQIA